MRLVTSSARLWCRRGLFVIAATVLLFFSFPKSASAQTFPIIAKYIGATQLKLDWDSDHPLGCEDGVQCDPADPLSYVLDVNTLEQRDVLTFSDVGYNIAIINWSSPLEVGHTYRVQMHGPAGHYRISQDFVYTGSASTNAPDGAVAINQLNISNNTNPVLSLFVPALPPIDSNCSLNGAYDLSVDMYVNGALKQTISGNCAFGSTSPDSLSFYTNDLFGNGNYRFVVHSASTGNIWYSNESSYVAPIPPPPGPFAVSNVTLNHSTGHYSFDYSGYAGGNITGESVAVHADNENWGFNHQPATCTGGATGAGSCSGIFNYGGQGTFSCADTVYVQIYGYHSGGVVHGLPNPDASCAPSPPPPPTSSPVSIPGCTIAMSPAPSVNMPEFYTGTLSFTNDTDNQQVKDITVAVYQNSDISYLTNNGWSIVNTGQGGNYFKRLHTDTNPIAPHTTQDFALNFGTTGADLLTIQAGNTGPDSTQVCGLAGIQFSALNAAPSTHFTASNPTVNHTTGDFSFDYSGYTGGGILAVSLSNDVAATSYNWPAGQIGYGPLSCTNTHCSGSPTHSTGVISCSDSLIFGIFDGSHVYYSNGLTVSDIDPSCTVNQPPAVSFTTGATTINEGDAFTGSGSFTDPDSTTWAATVDYGDGSGAQLLPLSPEKTFTLNHVYVDNGSYVITVSITDNQGDVGISTGSGSSIVVNNPAPVVPPITPPSNVGQDSPAVINVTFSDYGNQSHTATVNWGDGSGNQSVPVSGNDFSSGHNYQSPGTYTVTVVVVDSQGATTTQTLTITVLNVVPVVGTVSFPSTVAVSNSVPLSATFTDQGVIDTHTATINWGDGHTTNGVVSESHGSGSVSGSHAYAAPGSYTVTVSVADNDGGVGQATASTVAINQISALSPAGVWIGLKNSDDVGTKFDVKVEAFKGNTLVASGELDSFAGGSSGFNNAHLATIPFNSFSSVDLPTGSVLSVTVSVRNACVGSGHNSGVARLWFDDSTANSGFGATIAGSSSTYYLRDASALATTVGSGPKKTIDVQAGAKCSSFKPFATWSATL